MNTQQRKENLINQKGITMKFNLNLFQIVGALVFVLWTMGKVTCGIGAWLIPYGIGALLNVLTTIVEHFSKS